MKQLQRSLCSTALAVAALLLGPAPFVKAQPGVLDYDWNTSTEGFGGLQNPWGQVSGGWGGDFTFPIHSARMVGITALTEGTALSTLNTFLGDSPVPLTNLQVSVDVFKDSPVGWRPATGEPIPAFNDAFDNLYSSHIQVWLWSGGTQYSYGAELNDLNGLEDGISLQFLGMRNQAPQFSNLEVWLQTHQSTGNFPFTYRIDNLRILSGAAAPEPSALALLSIPLLGFVLGCRKSGKRMYFARNNLYGAPGV